MIGFNLLKNWHLIAIIPQLGSTTALPELLRPCVIVACNNSLEDGTSLLDLPSKLLQFFHKQDDPDKVEQGISPRPDLKARPVIVLPKFRDTPDPDVPSDPYNPDAEPVSDPFANTIHPNSDPTVNSDPEPDPKPDPTKPEVSQRPSPSTKSDPELDLNLPLPDDNSSETTTTTTPMIPTATIGYVTVSTSTVTPASATIYVTQVSRAEKLNLELALPSILGAAIGFVLMLIFSMA